MDIKNALNSILPIQLQKKPAIDRSIKSGDATDRDANGQMGYDQQKKHQEPMTDEQFEKALKALKELPAVKDHHLTTEVAMIDGKRFVLLKEPTGKLLRKISESELWTLPTMKDSDPNKKGQLLRKTA